MIIQYMDLFLRITGKDLINKQTKPRRRVADCLWKGFAVKYFGSEQLFVFVLHLMLTDIYQDTNGIGRLHEFNVPTFYATRAIKK